MAQAEFKSIVVPFACEVQWGNCDPAGIIFYPTYYHWFDAATWAFFAHVGYPARRMRAEHRSMPLVAADCQFRIPAEQGDRCEVRSRIARWGGKSFVVAHDVVRSDDKLLASGSETRVWGVHADGPGTPLRGETIPEALKALFQAA
jgi:4-hydroxybenzoyl-CoA thioesterase